MGLRTQYTENEVINYDALHGVSSSTFVRIVVLLYLPLPDAPNTLFGGRALIICFGLLVGQILSSSNCVVGLS